MQLPLYLLSWDSKRCTFQQLKEVNAFQTMKKINVKKSCVTDLSLSEAVTLLYYYQHNSLLWGQDTQPY